MFLSLVVAALVAVGIAEPEVETAAARSPISIQYEDHGYEDHHDSNDRGDRHHEDDHVGPNIVRVLDPVKIAQGPHYSRQNKIIMDTYRPDYYQPTWILDYRYQKTGGRDYTRSDGGQILILPKNVHSNERKIHGTFDELLEFLRLNNLAESEAESLHPEERNSYVSPESYGQQWQKDQSNLKAY